MKPRRRAFCWSSAPLLAAALGVCSCSGEPPGNPLPPASAITGAVFTYASMSTAGPANRVQIAADRIPELRGLFEGSRIDNQPARWVVWGDLTLTLKGGGTQTYTLYYTFKGPGAYSDHLHRYFRGGSDAAFTAFMKAQDNSKSP